MCRFGHESPVADADVFSVLRDEPELHDDSDRHDGSALSFQLPSRLRLHFACN